MKNITTRVLSNPNDNYYFPATYTSNTTSKTLRRNQTTTNFLEKKLSKESPDSRNQTTNYLPDDPNSTQNDYFPNNFLKTKVSIPKPANLKKINTKINPKMVSFQSETASLSSGLLRENYLIRKLSKEPQSSLLENDSQRGYFMDSRSRSIQNLHQNDDKSPKASKFKETILSMHRSDSKKNLQDKLNEYHVIKKFRKQSIINLTSNVLTNPPQVDDNHKIDILKRRKPTNPFDEIADPRFFLNKRKYKLARLIVSNLKLKEQTYINEEKLIRMDRSTEQFLTDFYTENPIYAIYDLPELINQALMKFKNPEEFFTKMNKITEKTFETKDRELYVYICKLSAKITSFYGENFKSLVIYKQCLQDCEKFDLLRLKMSIYKRIGRLYLSLQNFDKAKNNFLKMLHLALILKSNSYEILSYDYLGLIYYYKHDMKKAVYFHTRMLKGQLEDEHSLLREVAFTKLNSKKYLNKNKNIQINLESLNCSSSIENDSNFFDIKSEDIEFTEIKDYKKKFSERRKKTELSKMIQSTKGKVTEEIKYNSQLHKLNEIPLSKFLGKNEVTLPVTNIKDRLFQTLKDKNKSKDKKSDNFLEKISKNKNNLNQELLKKSFFICHLSCNRQLNSFLHYNRNVDSYNVSHGNNEIKIFLNKSDENRIISSLTFFKKNIFLAINAIKKITAFLYPNTSSPIILKGARRKGFLMGVV